MDTLFDYVGLELPKANLIVSDVVLKELSREASEKIGQHVEVSPQLISEDILTVLENYFKPKDLNVISHPTVKNSAISAIGNYLIMQDALECRSMKEIHSIASGLYDSVLSHLAAIVKSTTLKEVELNIFPYTNQIKMAAD